MNPITDCTHYPVSLSTDIPRTSSVSFPPIFPAKRLFLKESEGPYWNGESENRVQLNLKENRSIQIQIPNKLSLVDQTDQLDWINYRFMGPLFLVKTLSASLF